MFTFNIGIQIWNYIKTSIIDGYRYLFNYRNRQLTGNWYYLPIDNTISYSRGRCGHTNKHIPKTKYQKRIPYVIGPPLRLPSILASKPPPLPPPMMRRSNNLWEDTLRNNGDSPQDFIT